MKTCKDCLHYEVCADVMKQQLYIKEVLCGQKNPVCPQFTDRSEWVHLPCEVGDKVYQTDGIRIYESTIRVIEISSANTVYSTENIAFDERAIGDSIFLAREEAEKALERMKENDRNKIFL